MSDLTYPCPASKPTHGGARGTWGLRECKVVASVGDDPPRTQGERLPVWEGGEWS